MLHGNSEPPSPSALPYRFAYRGSPHAAGNEKRLLSSLLSYTAFLNWNHGARARNHATASGGVKENPVLRCVERIESSSRKRHDVLLENQAESESFLDVS